MNIVFIVPTGIGAAIGGHSGDATPAARLIASVCKKLFVHPNVVNAADINEMTDNMLYVEGSILDRFLEGQIGLKEIYQNKILLVVNHPVATDTINAVSAARSTLGSDIEILELDTPLKMIAKITDQGATGDIYGVDETISQVSKYDFDVLVVNTPIDVADQDVLSYLESDGGINIWGGVEAKLSKIMSEKLNRPVIHAPVEEESDILKSFNQIVDPRKSSEVVSLCYLHCCLKGGHFAPKISLDSDVYWNNDIDFLISPMNVFGRPHQACVSANIPIIYVEENTTILNDSIPDNAILVKNYLEAAGVICAKQSGIMVSSVKRPLSRTVVIRS